MFEKVNPLSPNKIADRIAGALVDEAYRIQNYPRVSIEVLIGHGICDIIAETSVDFSKDFVKKTVERITGNNKIKVFYSQSLVSEYSESELENLLTPDGSTFSIMPAGEEEKMLQKLSREIFKRYPSYGKYFCDKSTQDIMIMQSNCNSEEFRKQLVSGDMKITINPFGDWTFDPNFTTGANNATLVSDLGVYTGICSLHGRDICNPDVVLPIFAFLKAKETGKSTFVKCLPGQKTIDNLNYSIIVKAIKEYIINNLGGFEKMAEWGLV